MRLQIRHSCADFTSYRAARVKSLFNVESGANFSKDLDLAIEGDWNLGVIVGPSGSGKTSAGSQLGNFWQPGWPTDEPIVDVIAPDGDFDYVTGALSSVGLGDVPSWLRPYAVLSNGERYRADLARLVVEAPDGITVVDEFSSVVDRQIAQIGAGAFAKAWRRTGKQVVLLSCHYDVLDWLEPDWVLDTATGKFAGRGLHRRPRLEVDVWETDWSYWPIFEPHHYLKLPKMVAARCYVGFHDGEPICHLAVSPRFQDCGRFRGCRMVVLPEWQGAGVGMRFLNEVAGQLLAGNNRYKRAGRMLFHTSHPGLIQALHRSDKWVRVSRQQFGGNRAKCSETIRLSNAKRGRVMGGHSGYGGHLRGIQGFVYSGEPCGS